MADETSTAAPPSAASDSRGMIALVSAGAAYFLILPSCCCGLWGMCTNTIGVVAAVIAIALAMGVKRDVDAGVLDAAAAGPHEVAKILGFVALGLALVGYLWAFISVFMGVGLNALSTFLAIQQ